MRNRRFRPLAAVAACLAMSAFGTAGAQAAPLTDGAFNGATGGGTSCTALTGTDAGRLSCGGIVPTWDGVTPIDTNLFLPSNTPPAGGWAVIGVYHGWGGSKIGLNTRLRSY